MNKTPVELRKLWEKDRSEWTEQELVEHIAERYGPVIVPKCRVCGAELVVGACGGGKPTVYACVADNSSHYAESRWEDLNAGGDSVVMEFMRRFGNESAAGAELKFIEGATLEQRLMHKGKTLGVIGVDLKLTAYLDAVGWELSAVKMNDELHVVALLAWPKDWPEIVDRAFVEARGFEVS